MALSLSASALAALGLLIFLTAPFLTVCYAEYWARPFIVGWCIHVGLTLLALGVHSFKLFRCQGSRILQIALIAVDVLMASISSVIIFAFFFSSTPYLLILLFGVAEARKRFC